MWRARAASRDTKRTQEHRKDTKLWSLTVNYGKCRILCFAWSERIHSADEAFRSCASVGSIPATSTKFQAPDQGVCSAQRPTRHEKDTRNFAVFCESADDPKQIFGLSSLIRSLKEHELQVSTHRTRRQQPCPTTAGKRPSIRMQHKRLQPQRPRPRLCCWRWWRSRWCRVERSSKANVSRRVSAEMAA
jgi:hypothetical protein